MTAQAILFDPSDNVEVVSPTGGYASGDLIQLPDGRAGVVQGLRALGSAALLSCAVKGKFKVPKTANINLLDGGRAYWDYSAAKAHFKTANDRDFFAGAIVGDYAAAATEMILDLNVRPRYTLDLANGFRSLPVLTAGSPRLLPNGRGGVQMTFSATAEAQKLDALSYDGMAPSSYGIVEGGITIVDGGDNAALDISFGLASATHATDADAIAESLLLHFDGNSLNVNAESDDGTVEVAATDTTVDYVLGTRLEVWWDLRNLADIQLYIDGVARLTDTVFRLDAATGPLKLLAHMEKTADDTTANVAVDFLRARMARYRVAA